MLKRESCSDRRISGKITPKPAMSAKLRSVTETIIFFKNNRKIQLWAVLSTKLLYPHVGAGIKPTSFLLCLSSPTLVGFFLKKNVFFNIQN